MRRRVWCETLPYDELLAPRVLALLARYRLDLLLAVRPWQLGEIAAVHHRLIAAGVHVALWPMLEDERGRWASAQSQPAFVELADQLLAAVPAAPELVVDLEPAFAELERWKAWRPRWGAGKIGQGGGNNEDDRLGPAADGGASAGQLRNGGAGDGRGPRPEDRYAVARAAYADAVTRWQRAGEGRTRRVTTAVMPMLAFDTAGQWMQRALGTPADDLPVQRHSVMAYTSLFEGWSRGLVGRRRAEWMLGLCARRSRTRWGALAGISLGAVGTGAFGDEPVLRDPAELARDVAIARAAGISEISLFDLGGVLRRAPAEAWLEALCG